MERTTAITVMWVSMLIFILLLFTVAFYFDYKFKQLRNRADQSEYIIVKAPWNSPSHTETTKMRGDDDT
jgi:hypothetical protein